MTTNDEFPTASLDWYRTDFERAAKAVESAAEKLKKERAEMRTLVLAALAAGMSEAEVVRLSGMSKPTVRAWQGKK